MLSLLGLEEGHKNEIVENFSQTGKGEVTSLQREMNHNQQTNPKIPLMILKDNLHLREIKTSSSRKKTEGIILRQSRNLQEPPLGVNDNKFDISELP